MVGWHHGFSGHELGQTPGDGEGVLQSVVSQRVEHHMVTKQHHQALSVHN